MVKPLEMANIYWIRLRSGAIREVTSMLLNVRSHHGKQYWNEVLAYLEIRRNKSGKKALH